uniref:GH18 domain-containing protein n=2 Tax=Leptocylindrus danicus TaxID=163516 RepID=A0A7S2JY50_9STRA|mmetsp:Transcript_13457/g.20008  ORF Transcript_13457/g.20008 Transcript_13457/m.20008 type:complete len:157 (+) Transcript_13457:2-472(+)
MATPIGHYAQYFDFIGLAQHVDYFNVMSYDIHGYWDNPKTIGFHTDMTVVNYFDDSDHNQNNSGNHHNAAAAESRDRSTNSPDRKTDDALLFLNQSHDSEKTLRTATNHCASPSPPAAAVRNARSLLVSPLGMGSPNNSAVSHYYGAEERGDVDYP